MASAMRRSQGQLPWRTLSTIVTGGATCTYCGSRDDLIAHHKIPRRLGGLDLLSNLEPVCRSCHPGVEQTAAAHAELVWESPVPEGAPRRPRRRPGLIRPY
jgi:5-methylcytosine-specific restriction endonuclease McrA